MSAAKDGTGPHRLYVAEFPCGVVKVGMTKLPGNTRGTMLRFRGVRWARIHYGEFHNGGFRAEHDLLRRISRISTALDGREWFTGISFGAARQIVNQVTRSNRKLFGEPVIVVPESRKSKRGFASISAERRSQIASLGGKAAHSLGTAHRFTSDEAAVAGGKGAAARTSRIQQRAETALTA